MSCGVYNKIFYIILYMYTRFGLCARLGPSMYSRRRRRRPTYSVYRRPASRRTYLVYTHVSLLSGIYASGEVKRSKRVRGAIMRGAVLTHKTMHAARNVSLLWPKTRDAHLDDSIIYTCLFPSLLFSSHAHTYTVYIHKQIQY